MPRHAAAGQLGDDPVSAAVRAQVRTEVAREFFRNEHGRDPIDAREIAATIAKGSRPRTQTVAGFDLTFSPVKSVSTWAVADPHVAAQIELAHQAAVQDAQRRWWCWPSHGLPGWVGAGSTGDTTEEIDKRRR